MKPIERLATNGDVLISPRGKRSLCYSVCPVYIGQENRIIRYEYSFWDADKRKAKTYKQHILKEMLDGNWKLKKPMDDIDHSLAMIHLKLSNPKSKQ